MKSERARIIRILGGLCCLGIIIGMFLPIGDFLGIKVTLIECFEDIDEESVENGDKLVMLLCAAVFLYLMTFLAACFHGEQSGAGLSVTLLVLAVLDWYVYSEIDSMIFDVVPFGSYLKGIGAHLIGWSYRGLLLSGFLSLLFSIMGKGNEQEGTKQTEAVENRVGLSVSSLACPECGKPYDKEDTFCGRCGYRFKRLACPGCGSEGEEGDVFCKKCGIHLVEVQMKEAEQEKPAKCDAIPDIEDVREHSEQEAVTAVLSVEEEQFYTCITCGEKIPVTKHFCTRCGTKVDE